MPRTPDTQNTLQPDDLEPGDIEFYEEEFADEPFSRRRHKMPLTSRLLKAAIHTKGNSEEKRDLLNQAALAIRRSNKPLTYAEEKMVQKLNSWYEDSPLSDLLPLELLELYRRQFKLNQFNLNDLCKTEWGLSTEREPLFGSLFSKQADRLLSFTEYLTGDSYETMIPFFPNKGNHMTPFQDEDHFISSAYTYSMLLDYYSVDQWGFYETSPNTEITFAQIEDVNTQEELLSLNIILKKSFQNRELSSILAGDKPYYMLLADAQLVVEWKGNEKNNKQIIDELK
jgi:hypothetical protein